MKRSRVFCFRASILDCEILGYLEMIFANFVNWFLIVV